MIGLVLALAGCRGANCTELGCSGNLDLDFQGGTFPDGTYSVTADIGGQTTGCTFNLPGGNCGQQVAFVSGADLLVSLPTGMVGTPPQVQIKLVLDGDQVLTDRTVSVTWGEPFFPNGERCDDQGCASGEVTVPVP